MPYRGDAVSTEAAYTWIDSDAALEAAARDWHDVIAIDTEFMRTDTFYPIPGLYQIANRAHVWLIDPLAIEAWSPLLRVLDDAQTVKVMHACSEDLELLSHHLGVQPNNLFDTQLAYAFVSEHFSMSYANLAKQILSVNLDKHQTRSNWLRRPLSAEQLHYASEDVVHLIALFEKISAMLNTEGRWQWFAEDMADRGRFQATDPQAYFASIKKAWKLDGQQLAVLKALCAWRERQAMSEDVPRSRVVWDEHLFAFATYADLQIGTIEEMLPRPIARRYAEALVRAHTEGMALPVETPLPRPLSQGQGSVLKRLREIARDEALHLGIAPELLARKRSVEKCFRQFHANGELSLEYRGWRSALLGNAFLHVLGDSR